MRLQAEEREKKLQAEAKERELNIEREREREAMALKERELKFQAEAKERELKEKEMTLAIEREREREEREYLLEMKRLELSAVDNRNYNNSSTQNPSRVDLKRFPDFRDKDDPEAFIISFERACEDFEVKDEEKMQILRARISGTLTEIYSQMPSDQSKDFEAFKQLVYVRFGITAEQLRQKFRTIKKVREETFAQLGAKTTNYLNKWLEQEGADSVVKIKEVFALEQFYDTINTHLKYLIKERRPKTIREAANLADEINEIREHAYDAPKYKDKQWETNKFKRMQQPTKFTTETAKKIFPANANVPHNTPMTTGGTEGKVNKYSEGKRPELICWQCGKKGHRQLDCRTEIRTRSANTIPQKQTYCVQTVETEPTANMVATATEAQSREQADELPVAQVVRCYIIQQDDMLLHKTGEEIWVNGKQYKGLKDTGSQISIVHPDLLKPEDFIKGKTISLKGISKQPEILPVALVNLTYKQWSGKWQVAVSPEIPAPMLIGWDLLDHVQSAFVITRAQKLRQLPQEERPDTIAELTQDTSIMPVTNSQAASFAAKQKLDTDLQKYFQATALNTVLTPESPERFIVNNGLLYREILLKPNRGGNEIHRQLIVPTEFRTKIIQHAHGSIFGGHLGITRTKQRVSQNFFWPGMGKQIKLFCRTCHTCQLQGHGQDKTKAQLCPLPIISQPFQRLAIDIIGRLPKASRRGHHYLLTIVDFATRYPEAIPLRNIETETVASALISYMCRLGFAEQIVTDLGASFTSKLMQRLWERCGIKHITSTAYHPQTNGLVERFNGSLIRMLRAYVTEHPHDWDDNIQALLYAYRSIPQESTGFSPFELLFGRKVKGPLDLLRFNWEGRPVGDSENVVDYLFKLQNTLKRSLELAGEHCKVAQHKQKVWYDKKARVRSFEPGQDILLIRPVKGNKLQLTWEGPFKIISKMNDVNYIIQYGEGRRVVHVNMIKPYYKAEGWSLFAIKEDPQDMPIPCWEREKKPCPITDIKLDPQLTQSQQEDVKQILTHYAPTFSNKPGIAKGVMHQIDTGDAKPIALAPYRITGHYIKTVTEEVQEMLKAGIIVPSSSAWAAPVLLLDKPDGTIRFCLDFRRLNHVTKSDAYPMPRLDNLIEKIGSCKYISSLDLTKGYYQIPMHPKDREKTAFRSPIGLYEFTVMAFGLKNAPATFQRLMDKVLNGLYDFTIAYLDDIAIFSKTWEEHKGHLKIVLHRIQEAGLTIKAAKCHIGGSSIKYLGHMIGDGQIKPLSAKVEAIATWPKPTTKKKVRAFLGLVGYYRKFIPKFSEIAAPLSSLTGKKITDPITWTAACQTAFDKLKNALISQPILATPDFGKPFTVYTDASNDGLGAVLCQPGAEDELHPVVYLSKKLLPREKHLSTIEKECLAIIWALQRLKPYLWGRTFELCTDHSPLIWLRSMKTNSKLMRWALILQDFDFTIKSVKGTLNIVADALSRKPGSHG